MRKLLLAAAWAALSVAAAHAEDHPTLTPGDEAFSAEHYEEAATLYRREAELGMVASQVNLAFLYLDGLGVSQSYEDAATWFGRAAEQGNAEAQHNLGLLYRDGKGVRKDLMEAIKWLSLSSAKNEVAALEKQATTEQLSEASKRIEVWRANHGAATR